ncbi:MAG: ABC transporter substrate binding protein [Nitrospirota bacterium]
MVKRKFFLTTAVLLLLLFNAAVSESFEIVVLKSAEIRPYNEALEGFRTTCGCTVEEMLLSENHGDIGMRIRAKNPDAIFAIGIDALRNVTAIKDTPVIYTMVPRSLPDNTGQRNISGISMFISPSRQFDTILELFPKTKRIGIVYDPVRTNALVNEAVNAARTKGIEMVVRKARGAYDVPALIDDMEDRIDVFWMLPDTTVINPETVNYMLLFSFRNKVPVFTFSKKYVEMGALAALDIVPFDMGAQAGEIIRKLLDDGKVKSPVRADARKTVLTINRKVARKLGIKIRDEIMNRAENVD